MGFILILNIELTDPINQMDRNYNELASMLNAQAMHYDGSNNIIISWGFIPGGRDEVGGGGGI